MTLQTRLTVILAAGVVLVITGFQGFQYAKLRSGFEKIEQHNAQILKGILSDNANDVERSLQFGISEAMASGDMDAFTKVAQVQKELRGLQEFSLYNDKGLVSYSSDSSRLKSAMEPALKQQLFDKPERLVRESVDQIEIYEPRVVSKDCMQCHTEWKIGDVAGVTLFRYSKAALAKEQDDSLAVTRQARSSNLLLAGITIGGSLAAIIALVAVIIVPVTKRLGRVVESLGQQARKSMRAQRRFRPPRNPSPKAPANRPPRSKKPAPPWRKCPP